MIFCSCAYRLPSLCLCISDVTSVQVIARRKYFPLQILEAKFLQRSASFLHRHVGCVAVFSSKNTISPPATRGGMESREGMAARCLCCANGNLVCNLNAIYEEMTIDASITSTDQCKPGRNGSAHRMSRQQRSHQHALARMQLKGALRLENHLMRSMFSASDPASNHPHNDQRPCRLGYAAVLRHAQCVAGKNCCSHPYTAFARRVAGPARVSAFSITLHAIKARR